MRAASSLDPSTALPDVPTIADACAPGYSATVAWPRGSEEFPSNVVTLVFAITRAAEIEMTSGTSGGVGVGP